jgi:GNAT superfamily N-acetyltransferase
MSQSHESKFRLVDVQAVKDRKTFKEFLDFPRQVYATDPHWVEPLRFERKRQWSQRNPWFEHARAMPFLARSKGRVVGVISAQVDELQEDHAGRKVGYFGQLEGLDCPHVFRALFEAADDWLRAQGCELVRGPYDLGVNQACGLLVDGRDRPPMVMMGHAPGWYAGHIESLGFRQAMDLLAYELRPDFEPPSTMARLLDRLGGRIVLRPMDFSNYSREVELLRDIFNDAWSRNWGFVPLTRKEFSHMGAELRQIIRPGYTCIAEIDGETAGFIVALPNINELVADLRGSLFPFGWVRLLWRIKTRRATTARVPLMGVRRKFQRGPVSAAISFAMIDQVRHALSADGIGNVELSWILETNQGMNSLIEAMGGRLYKRYRIFEKELI